MPSQPDLDGSRVHASRRGARSAPSLAPVRQQPSSSLAQSLFVSKLHGALKKPEPAEVTPEVDALLGKGSGDLDSTGAKAHSGGGRRGYTKAEVEEIRARINALIDAYEALELEERSPLRDRTGPLRGWTRPLRDPQRLFLLFC